MFRPALLFTVFLLLFGLTACNRMPGHAKYIPGDAVVVAGIHTGSIGKKIAWDAIMGSDLIKKMKENSKGQQKGLIDELEKTGIEGMSTFYVYMQPDKRFITGNRIVALLPLEDAAMWSDFVKRVFPTASIKKGSSYSEALLQDNMYAGWNNELLVLMNTVSPLFNADMVIDSLDTSPTYTIDETQQAAEMANAFGITAETSIIKNERFKELQSGNNDISLWVNYEEMIAGGAQADLQQLTGGMSLSNTLWKDAAMAAGFKFDDGHINGDMRYYISETLKEAGIEMGKTDMDKEMLANMPTANMNMMMGWHVAPTGVKILLEKMGALGFINLILTRYDMSADYILEAFTGDMALSVNDIGGIQTTTARDTAGISQNITSGTGNTNFTYVFKIGKKENFEKLLQVAVREKNLLLIGNNTYTTDSTQQFIILQHEGYIVVSNKREYALNYAAGKYKSGKKNDAVKEISGNPFGIYVDVKTTINSLKPYFSTNYNGFTLPANRDLAEQIIFKGGSFRKNAFECKMDIVFTDKKENSLLQIIDFATQMSNVQAN